MEETLWPKASRVAALAAATSLLGACASTGTTANLRAAEDASRAPAGTIARPPRAAAPLPAAPPPAGTPPPAIDEAIFKRPELPDLEEAALLRHPALVAAAHRVRALAERARAEGKLPSPELGTVIQQVPFARPYALDRAGLIMFSVRQSIPAVAALDRTAEATSLEARAEASRLAAEARALVREVDRTFADYLEAISRHAAHMGHRAALDQLSQAARGRYTTGGALGDVTKADLERARVDAEMERERGMVMVARARLNGLLARPVDAWLGPPDPDEPETAALTPGGAAELARQSPEVDAAELMEKSARSGALAAGAEASVPAFTVSLDAYLPVNSTPAGYGTSLSMSLPWLWGAGAGRARSAAERAAAEKANAGAVRLRAESFAVTALAALRAAERRYNVLTRLARPAARRAIEAAQAGYLAGAGDILSWLDAARSALDVEMDIAGARGELDRALADLDWATGTRVPRVPVSASKEQLHED
jgi:outer membrane protein TolC